MPAFPIRHLFFYSALASGFLCGVAEAQLAPSLARNAVHVGQQSPSVPLKATVWLPLHNKAAFDAVVAAIYTPSSPSYHKFLQPADLKAYAPTAAELEAVQKELASHNLSVLKVDPANYSIQFSGQTSDFEAAFHTVVDQYRKKDGTRVNALTKRPTLANEAAVLDVTVTGASGEGMHNQLRRRVNPATGKQSPLIRVADVLKPQGAAFSSQCFYQPQTVTLGEPGTPGQATATYTGLVYGAPATNTALGTLSPCGYSPQDVAKLYNLNVAYGQGYTGKGVTVAIVDGYGSPTIQSDLQLFVQEYGQPLTGSFTVKQTTPFTATDADAATETTLDVEWTHAIAPDANILLVTTPTLNDDDLQAGLMYIIENKLASIISNSYGTGELTETAQEAAVWNQICEMAAAEGIAVQFASGDDGDYADIENGQTDVSVPADVPYATAVGGTSLALSPFDGTTVVQSGWGDQAALLSANNQVYDPPQFQGFQGGSGGGTSRYFPLPAYQASLGGSGRQLPDVSALADPMTGVEIIQTVNGTPYFELLGGTSLAAPVFSAEWALLTQRFGFALGQAGPYIAQAAGTQALDDLVAPPEAALVTGSITDSNGTTNYTADELSQVTTKTPYQTAFESDGQGNVALYTFAADSSLTMAPGWDPVTGWGTLDMGNIFTATAGVK